MLKKLHYILLVLIVSSLLLSCASPIKKTDIQSVSRIGILNKFDEEPRFMIIGSTIFTNKVSKIDNPEFKLQISDSAKTFLEAKGYQVQSATEENKNKFDLYLEIRPTSVYRREYLEGYGIYEKYYFGESTGPKAYISIAVDPYLNNKRYRGLTIYQADKFKLLSFDHLTESWGQLTKEQQGEITSALHSTIDEAINDVLTQSGL